MPKLTGIAEQIISFFDKEQLFAWAQIIKFDSKAADTFLLHLKGKLLPETSTPTPITTHIDNFNARYLRYLSESTRDLLDNLRKISQQTLLVMPQLSKIQAEAIGVLLDPVFLKMTNYLFSFNLIDNAYEKVVITLYKIAKDDSLSPVEQEQFLNDLRYYSLNLSRYFYFLEMNGTVKDHDFEAYSKYVLLLPLKFYQPSIFNRLAAFCLNLFMAIVGNIVLLNPIATILRAISERNANTLFWLLKYPFLPLLSWVYVVPKLTKLGWQSSVIDTLDALHTMADRHLLLSVLVIGLAIGGAMALLFLPPLVTFLLSLPYLSVLAGLSAPLLATITGLFVLSLSTAFAAIVTALVTTAPKPIDIESNSDSREGEDVPYLLNSAAAQPQQGEVLGQFTEVLQKEMPVLIEHTFTTVNSFTQKCSIHKGGSRDLNGLSVYYRNSGKFDIYVTEDRFQSVTHTIKIGADVMVIRDNKIDSEIPGHVSVKIYAPAPRFEA